MAHAVKRGVLFGVRSCVRHLTGHEALCGVGLALVMSIGACGDDESTADSVRGDAGHKDAEVAGDAGHSSTDSNPGACTRAKLAATIDAYYVALAARDPSKAPLSEHAKYTEDGKTVTIGEGFWQTAGALKFKRSVLDVETCSSVTESVVDDDGTDRVMGLRLKTEAGKIVEAEAIIIHTGDFPFAANPQALIDSASDDWETPLPPDERASRESLTLLVDRYFKLFPAGACSFRPGCQRLENGFAPPGYDCDDLLSCDMTTDVSTVDGAMKPRLHVIDEQTSVAVGFAMWSGMYTDFHMFKVRDGEVVGVHATLAAASSSGWD